MRETVVFAKRIKTDVDFGVVIHMFPTATVETMNTANCWYSGSTRAFYFTMMRLIL